MNACRCVCSHVFSHVQSSRDDLRKHTPFRHCLKIYYSKRITSNTHTGTKSGLRTYFVAWFALLLCVPTWTSLWTQQKRHSQRASCRWAIMYNENREMIHHIASPTSCCYIVCTTTVIQIQHLLDGHWAISHYELSLKGLVSSVHA